MSLRHDRLLLVGVLVLSLLGQFVVLGRFLDDSLVNAISPTSVDTEDYWLRAQLLLDGRYSDAFGDAYRMPGYSAVLAAADVLTPAPLLATRLLQILAILIAAIAAEHVVRRITGDRTASLATSAIVAFYPPFWYLGPLLYAEAFTVVGIAMLLVVCSGIRDNVSVSQAAALGVALAALTYLKPNNVVMVLPVAIFLVARGGRTRQTAAGLGLVVAVLTALVLPWTAATSASQDRLVLLSTNNGYTFYRGSGVWVPSEPSLPRTAAIGLGLADAERDSAVKARGFTLPRGTEADAYWRGEAVATWRDEPWRTSVYAGSKVAHSLGLSLGGLADILLLTLTLTGAAATAVLLRLRRHRAWVGIAGGTFVGMAAQVALYVPDVRFRVSLLDLPLIVLVGLAAAAWRERAATATRASRSSEAAVASSGPRPTYDRHTSASTTATDT